MVVLQFHVIVGAQPHRAYTVTTESLFLLDKLAHSYTGFIAFASNFFPFLTNETTRFTTQAWSQWTVSTVQVRIYLKLV